VGALVEQGDCTDCPCGPKPGGGLDTQEVARKCVYCRTRPETRSYDCCACNRTVRIFQFVAFYFGAEKARVQHTPFKPQTHQIVHDCRGKKDYAEDAGVKRLQDNLRWQAETKQQCHCEAPCIQKVYEQ